MHNGFIGSWSRLRRQVEALIPDALYPARIGTTDSEAMFLAMIGAGMEHPVAAAESVLATAHRSRQSRPIPAIASASPPRCPTASDLYAFRYAVNDKANTLYYRETERGIVIVSEPLDSDQELDGGAGRPRRRRQRRRAAPAWCRCFSASRKRRNNAGLLSLLR